jgi:MtN3 and saliva related transmembrane protein
MNLDIITNITNIIAGILIIISFLPQLIHIIKQKSAKDVSFGMYIILFIGQITWIIYGVLINNLQIILTNVITGTITILIMIFSFIYRERRLETVNVNLTS